ncbi:MAG: endonuclease V [Myxococcota bacterium]
MVAEDPAWVVAIDVDYRDDQGQAATAGVCFTDWRAAEPTHEATVLVSGVQAYVPGDFYRRELPCILELLRALEHEVGMVVVDGYVWLSEDGRPGLGAHVYEALGRRVPVVGVAKNSFAGSPMAIEVRRGQSQRPLFVTTVGVEAEEAARWVESMHGPYRIPTLLKRVDALARAYPR